MNTTNLIGKSVSLSIELDSTLAKELNKKSKTEPYDIDMLYVECRQCGKPVIWEQGRTKSLIAASGIDIDTLDAHCLILSEGCPGCRPDSMHFQMHMVRMAVLSVQDLFLLSDTKGSA